MAGIANTPQQQPSVSQQLWPQQYAQFYRALMPASYYQTAQVPAPHTQQADLTYQSPTSHAGQHVPPVAQNHQYGYSYGYSQQAPLPYQMYPNPYSPGPATASQSGYYGPSANSYIYGAHPYGAAMNAMSYGRNVSFPPGYGAPGNFAEGQGPQPPYYNCFYCGAEWSNDGQGFMQVNNRNKPHQTYPHPPQSFPHGRHSFQPTKIGSAASPQHDEGRNDPPHQHPQQAQDSGPQPRPSSSLARLSRGGPALSPLASYVPQMAQYEKDYPIPSAVATKKIHRNRGPRGHSPLASYVSQMAQYEKDYPKHPAVATKDEFPFPTDTVPRGQRRVAGVQSSAAAEYIPDYRKPTSTTRIEVEEVDILQHHINQEDNEKTAAMGITEPLHQVPHSVENMPGVVTSYGTPKPGAASDASRVVQPAEGAQASSRTQTHAMATRDSIHDSPESGTKSPKDEQASQMTATEASPLVQEKHSIDVTMKANGNASTTRIDAVKSPKSQQSDIALADKVTEAWAKVEDNNNGKLASNSWDDTPPVEGWDDQRSEDWTPREKRRRPQRNWKDNNRSGYEPRRSRSTTSSTSTSPPSKRVKEQPVSVPAHQPRRAEPVRRERSVLPTNTAWGNFAAVIKQDDQEKIAKAKEDDKRDAGVTVRPEIQESYKDPSGKAESTVHKKVVAKGAITPK